MKSRGVSGVGEIQLVESWHQLLEAHSEIISPFSVQSKMRNHKGVWY